jgi:hypothetical protein
MRGQLRNAPLNTPTATRSTKGKSQCFVLVADPRWPRGRRAQRVCNSACGLPSKKPSAHCQGFMRGAQKALTFPMYQ